jgi:serine/threonine protein kinase
VIYETELSPFQQLGDCLGRGAFGSVYRGLNWMTGETVAVKQIQLGNIPRSELGEIMSEIDLLKNLKVSCHRSLLPCFFYCRKLTHMLAMSHRQTAS